MSIDCQLRLLPTYSLSCADQVAKPSKVIFHQSTQRCDCGFHNSDRHKLVCAPCTAMLVRYLSCGHSAHYKYRSSLILFSGMLVPILDHLGEIRMSSKINPKLTQFFSGLNHLRVLPFLFLTIFFLCSPLINKFIWQILRQY